MMKEYSFDYRGCRVSIRWRHDGHPYADGRTVCGDRSFDWQASSAGACWTWWLGVVKGYVRVLKGN